MMKYIFALITAFWCLTGAAQDSCFRKPSLEPLAITRNIDSIHLLMKEYWQSFTGCKGPEVNCTAIDGTKITPSTLPGNATVLNFWFTHCIPCVGEFGSLNKLTNEFGGREVRFLSFALDKKEVLDTFLINHPLSYKVIPSSGEINADFRISSYPTNIIMDKDWRVVQVITGRETINDSNYTKLKFFIEQALKK